MGNPYEAKSGRSVAPADPRFEAKVNTNADNVNTNDKVSEVPEGSISEILEWVSDDKEKAQTALDRENDGKGRKTLIDSLEEILGE